jgi:hypothetical protein
VATVELTGSSCWTGGSDPRIVARTIRILCVWRARQKTSSIPAISRRSRLRPRKPGDCGSHECAFRLRSRRGRTAPGRLNRGRGTKAVRRESVDARLPGSGTGYRAGRPTAPSPCRQSISSGMLRREVLPHSSDRPRRPDKETKHTQKEHIVYRRKSRAVLQFHLSNGFLGGASHASNLRLQKSQSGSELDDWLQAEEHTAGGALTRRAMTSLSVG